MDLFSRLSIAVGDALAADDVSGALSRASEALLRGDHRTAEREALAVLDRRKDHPRAYLVLGFARRGLGDLEGARAALREALRRSPGDGTAHLALAECELALGDPARALWEAARAREGGAPLAETALLFARAHLARRERREARSVLEALPPAQRPPEALALLGDLQLEMGDATAAQASFELALARGTPRPEVLAGLARALHAQGRTSEALPHALRALSEAPRDAAAATLVGDLHAAMGDGEAARVAYERALEISPRHGPALRGAAAAALARGDLARARELFGRVLADDPEDPAARAGLERIELHERLREETLARERVAASEARLALRPDELYALLVRAQRLLSSAPELEDLAAPVGALREGYDRPLLLAIAGEFNAGKSTLLNALLGEAVAPMGVTPTTAAVNVFVHGTRRAARAILRDGSAVEIELDRVADFIDRRRGAGGAAVRYVEIVWPAEPLRDVSLVDTPGFNAAEEEHEAVARAFLARADAVLWVFDAAHAGSASERGAIEALGPLRGRVLGVLNKAERLTEEERAQVMRHLSGAFAGEVADWVAVSSLQALEARRATDEAALAASGFGALWSALEARFFGRARAVKRETTTARFQAVLGEARARIDAAARAAAESAGFGKERRRAAQELGQRLRGELVPALEGAHRAGLQRLLADTAQDALEVARRQPRGITALLAPRIDEADLRHLGRVAADRVRGHLDELCARADAGVRELARAEIDAWRAGPERARGFAEPLLAFAARAVDRAPEELREGPFARALAFAQGWFEAGGLSQVAPALARAEDLAAAEAALRRALPAELPWREPLLGWMDGLARLLEAVALEVEQRSERAYAEIEWRLRTPLGELERQLAGLGV